MSTAITKHAARESGGTREKLLLCALVPYARQGIHGVSLLTTSTASGSRNFAAVRYHFGNKRGVIWARTRC